MPHVSLTLPERWTLWQQESHQNRLILTAENRNHTLVYSDGSAGITPAVTINFLPQEAQSFATVAKEFLYGNLAEIPALRMIENRTISSEAYAGVQATYLLKVDNQVVVSIRSVHHSASDLLILDATSSVQDIDILMSACEDIIDSIEETS